MRGEERSIDDAPLPKTTWRPSRCGVSFVVMKNWEPLVLGPALAMERRPGSVCLQFTKTKYGGYVWGASDVLG